MSKVERELWPLSGSACLTLEIKTNMFTSHLINAQILYHLSKENCAGKRELDTCEQNIWSIEAISQATFKTEIRLKNGC
jgi:hypothetical protein